MRGQGDTTLTNQPNTFISLRSAAKLLNISYAGLADKFRRTDFLPVMRINQIPYYRRSDFDAWAIQEIGTQVE